MRQAIEHVQIDRMDAPLPHRVDHGLCLLVGLNSINGRLNLGIEILNAEAHARKTELAQRHQLLARRAARVDFDRTFEPLAAFERLGEKRRQQLFQVFRRKERRRPAT